MSLGRGQTSLCTSSLDLAWLRGSDSRLSRASPFIPSMRSFAVMEEVFRKFCPYLLALSAALCVEKRCEASLKASPLLTWQALSLAESA
ncbi:hypothetical protein AVEN_198960-1 [Araneus ventricosus]|uniref:Uncharacterized protein n=1 Tax=Araneus ventricosus TaxID=182803 RepID=A0A4Y2UY62_ARAVE|nr:hypothetical protein AVEN_198960-1 [Araneus ventricosus]